MSTPPLLLLAAVTVISLSLLVSANPSLNATGGLPQNATGGSRPASARHGNNSRPGSLRPGRKHRGGLGIQANANADANANANAIAANISRGDVTPVTPVTPVVPLRKANQWLDTQNAIRASVGEPPLEWDRNLAKYARNWANGRVATCQMIHSEGPYGENIFWGMRDHWTPAQIVDMWVDEVQFYDLVHNSCEDGKICGHYTQVVWRDSTKVGCARVTCNSGGMYAICVYDPPGNYIDENPFIHHDW